MFSRNLRGLAILVGLAAALTAFAADNRTKLKPGFNLFSTAQDVEVGRESAKEAERQLQILNDRQAIGYIDSLGKRLAARAPGEKYPFQFKIVNDNAINAFALPGGFIYVNRGAIQAADTEAQIAGVMAHEIGHVVLRHGTHAVSRAYIAQAPFAIVGGVLGNNAITSVLTQVGGLGLNVLFLKNSRDAETQADLMGTQILRDSGYDPKAMVEFFEKIQAESKGGSVEFFSDHPNPENRIVNVQREIERMNGASPNARKDSADFHTAKNSLASMPAPKKAAAQPATNGGRPSDSRSSGQPPAPSTRRATYSGQDLQFQYPDNWRQFGQGSATTIAPEGGIINGALAYGMMVSTFEGDDHGRGRISLDEATDQLLKDLQGSNPSMRITLTRQPERVGGRSSYLTEASNQSPAGARETDWIATTIGPDGVLYYFVGVAPENDFSGYSRAFQDVIDSVKFK